MFLVFENIWERDCGDDRKSFRVCEAGFGCLWLIEVASSQVDDCEVLGGYMWQDGWIDRYSWKDLSWNHSIRTC